MPEIIFQDRKYGSSLDASFGLWDGERLADVSSYQVGDTVSVCFPDEREKQAAINENQPASGDYYFGSGDGFIRVKCVVVRRSHSVVWKDTGKLQELMGMSIVLEAADGYWEDVLKWIMLGERPAWVPLP